MNVTLENLDHVFDYHAPRPDQLPKYAAVREAAKNFAKVIIVNAPIGADRSAAIRLLREAMMTTNAAIALSGPEVF